MCRKETATYIYPQSRIVEKVYDIGRVFSHQISPPVICMAWIQPHKTPNQKRVYIFTPKNPGWSSWRSAYTVVPGAGMYTCAYFSHTLKFNIHSCYPVTIRMIINRTRNVNARIISLVTSGFHWVWLDCIPVRE